MVFNTSHDLKLMQAYENLANVILASGGSEDFKSIMDVIKAASRKAS